MKTRTLGRTGVSVTALGMGCVPLGDLYVTLTEEGAAQTMDAAWTAGVRYYDTSPWYGRGQSEHRTGRFLYRKPRHDYVLSTKIGRVLRRPLKPGPFQRDSDWIGGLEFAHDMDYSYDGVMRSFEDSLQRLGINSVDLLLIHDIDFWHHKTEAKVTAYLNQLFTSGWRALAALRDQDAIKGIGAGINELGMIPRFLDMVDIDFFLVAMRYTLLEQEMLDAEFPRCAERGVGVVIGGTYNSGILATGAVPGAFYNYAPAGPEIMDRVRRIETVCRAHQIPLAGAALQFPLGHPIVASVIPGSSSAAQAKQNADAFNHPIPSDFWSELKHEGLLRADAPTPA